MAAHNQAVLARCSNMERHLGGNRPEEEEKMRGSSRYDGGAAENLRRTAALRETAEDLRRMAKVLEAEAAGIEDETYAAERAAVMPAGYVEHVFRSQYEGSHPEYCSEWEDVYVAAPAGMAVPAGMNLYHTTRSNGNWDECFAAVPGCKVWDGEAWAEPHPAQQEE
jgi:hypothetical protein